MTQHNQTILITGFPGFIAGRLVERLASADTRFFLLVQQSFLEKASMDIALVAGKTGVPPENFVAVEGDITLENLGMSETDLAAVREETTDVYHLAAIYDLDVEKDLAYLVNVEGTRNVNELVRSLPKLRRYNYISTCYVAGKRIGTIYENELEHDAGFRNYYEETKYYAEVEVEKLKRDLPVAIFRPSVVCGDSTTGETAKFDGVYYVMKFLLRAPELFRLVNVGNDRVRLNLVPVDFIVDAMAALHADDRAVGKTIALADPNPLKTKEICDAIAVAIVNKRSIITPPPKLVETLLSTRISPPLTGLPLSGVPYFFIPQSYDTRVSEELLAPHNVACPDFRDYVKNLVRFLRENPKL